jgi:hypothetical protein
MIIPREITRNQLALAGPTDWLGRKRIPPTIKKAPAVPIRVITQESRYRFTTDITCLYAGRCFSVCKYHKGLGRLLPSFHPLLSAVERDDAPAFLPQIVGQHHLAQEGPDARVVVFGLMGFIVSFIALLLVPRSGSIVPHPGTFRERCLVSGAGDGKNQFGRSHLGTPLTFPVSVDRSGPQWARAAVFLPGLTIR